MNTCQMDDDYFHRLMILARVKFCSACYKTTRYYDGYPCELRHCPDYCCSDFWFMMAIGIGANDVANAMGTSVGSKALTVKQAIIIAMIFEFAGAYLAGGEVTDTIRKGVIETSLFASQPDILVFGMMSALLAAGTWLLLASYMGWPVSTTHSIIGAIIGFACVSVGTEAVDWSSVQGIVGSWIITPVISGFFAYVIFVSAQRLIFDTENPLFNAKRFVPVYMFITTMVIALVTIKKGLKHVGLHLTNGEAWMWAVAVSALVMAGGYFYIQKNSLTVKKTAALLA